MKFTIRDLFLVTMIVALAVGWWLERRRCDKLQMDLAVAEEEVRSDEEALKGYARIVDKIELALPSYGLTISWPGAQLKRLDLATHESMPNSSASGPNPPKP